MTAQFVTPVGRLVLGNPFEPQTKNAEGQPLTIKSGPNAGQPRVSYFVGIAIPKTDPGVGELLQRIHTTARDGFPQLFDAASNCIYPGFAFKYIDGDSTTPNRKGKVPAQREGFAGCWVLQLSSGFAPDCYDSNNQKLTDPQSIKRGYYVRANMSVVANGSQNQPGVFLNFNMLQLCAYGEEIVSGPDPDAAFGADKPALPQGASATPLAPAAAPPVAPGQAPATSAPAAPAGVQPHPGFVTGAAGTVPAPPTPQAPAVPPVAPAAPPAPPAPPAAPAAPVERKFVVDGVSHTESALRAAGYTDAHFAALPEDVPH